MITNIAGDWIESEVVGPHGEWSVGQAARMVFQNEAIFMYRHSKVTDLAMLPER